MKRTPRISNSTRRGTVLVVVVVLLLVIASIAGALLRAALFDSRQFEVDRQALQADRLAEAGLARAIARLEIDANYEGETWQASLADGEVSHVVIRVDRDGDTPKIESLATYPDASPRPVRSRRSLSH